MTIQPGTIFTTNKSHQRPLNNFAIPFIASQVVIFKKMLVTIGLGAKSIMVLGSILT